MGNKNEGYVRRVGRHGDSYIRPASGASNVWVSHTDPDFVAWLGSQGYSMLDEMPIDEDLRDHGVRCARCGVVGTELHHWAPKEWVGADEADRWPMAELCRPCHRTWHRAAELAAARVTVRILRGKGMHETANRIEDALDGARLPLGWEGVEVVT